MATATLYFASSVSGTVSTPANALGVADGTFTTDANTNTSWTHRWRLDIQSGATPSGTQSVTLRMRKGSNSGDPTVSSVELFQSGVSLGTLTLFSGSTTISSTTGQDLVYQFAGSLLADTVDVDIEIVTVGAGGSPSARNAASVDSGTWDLAYTVGYTVVANNGSYTATGQTATLLHSSVLTADSGTYAVTGQTASLLQGFLLTADSGTYALTGQTATVDYVPISGYTVTADSGTYTVTGQTATILREVKLSADAGSYAVTGEAVTFSYGVPPRMAWLLQEDGFAILQEDGSYLITEPIEYIVEAAYGTYSLTGQTATLTQGFLITADSGTYALTGQVATVEKDSILTADAGSYAVTGQAAEILRGYALAADSGSYAVTGQAATVAWTPVGAYALTADAGSYVLTGQTASLDYAAVVSGNVLRRWNGYTWVVQAVQSYDHIDWTFKPLRRWDGSDWV